MNTRQAVPRIRIRNGLDIPLKGRPEQIIHPGPKVEHVALCGPDYLGLKPRMLVAEGDQVGLGQALFVDKRDPDIPYVSPGRGTVVAINRGARRVLESVVVRLEESGPEDRVFKAWDGAQLTSPDRDAVVERLQQSGLWTAFRTRPFSRVPLSHSTPDAVFVTALDTRPLAADPLLVIREQPQAFADGLNVISVLSRKDVSLCSAPGWDVPLPGCDRVKRFEFTGPHPAGLVGTHIHFLHPVGAQRTVWHIGYQDVIAIGRLFREGRIDTTRVVALGGARVAQPRLLATRCGASTEEFTDGEITGPDSARVISGCVLDGRTAAGGLAFLGRYQQQVTVIGEGGGRHFLGWTGLFPRRYSAARTFLKLSGHKHRLFLSTAQNGRFTGMLPTRAFEQVMPLDILPSPLFRALLVKDTDQAQALGCLELAEEDLTLCSFLCPAKNDYGAVLRINLEQIERGG